MAKVFVVRKADKTYYIPATSTCQSRNDAISELGFTAGRGIITTTQFTGDLSAEDWIAKQKAETAPTTTPTPTPTPTTPTPTPTPPATTTTPPTTPPATTGGDALLIKERLDRQLAQHNKANNTNYDIAEYLNALPGITQRTRDTLLKKYNEALEQGAIPSEYTPEQLDDYNDYLAFLQTPDGKNFPTPKDVADYLSNREQWIADYDLYLRGYTEEQLREFNTWKRYASNYGDITDWYATNIEDWLANYDKAQEQLALWQQEHGTALEEEEAAEEYALSPEEAARRREESYRESREYATERYTEAPMYQEEFRGWLDGQARFSGALERYVESQYPSLVSGFKGEQPRLTGKPTREEARGEAARREQAFKAWLPEQEPSLYQKYMSQRPTERGERLWMQAPNVRELNFKGW